MGDDKEETSRKLSAKSGANQAQKAAMTGGDKTANSQRRRRRRRRSLFSLLFTGGGGSQANIDQESDNSSEEETSNFVQKKEISSSQDSLRKQVGKKNSQKMRPRNQDVVLIKPREAKCAEATLVSLVQESHEADDEAEEGGALARTAKDTKVTTKESSAKRRSTTTKDNNSDQQKNTLQSLVKRKMRSFKVSAKSKSHDDDADSYILDLNDCLDREKLRVSSSSSSSSASSSSSLSEQVAAATTKSTSNENLKTQAKEFSPLREISPIDDKWQTNKEYIPTATVVSTRRETNNNNLDKMQPKTLQDKRRQQQKSPLLVEFLESHQIKLRRSGSKARSGDSLDAKRTASPPTRSGSSSSSSSCDSARANSPASGLARLPPVSYFDELNAETRATTKLNELSESERRLYHWRKLAARSVTMWQVPDESSSDEEEDDSDLGDFIDCQSPARVCYCSDDTSCSSVELIWSRPSGPQPQLQLQQVPAVRIQRDETSPTTVDIERQRALLTRPLLTRPLHLETTPSSASSTDLNQVSPRPSLSPARQHAHLQVSDRPSSHSRSPTPQRLQVYNHQLMMRYAPNSNNSSLKSVCSSQSSAAAAPCQRPAILELAKPSRARDRRIGDKNNNNNDHLNSKRRTREEKLASRRSMPAPLAPGQVCLVPGAGEKRTRDWSAVPVSRPASGSDWVPNPLFGRLPPGKTTQEGVSAGEPNGACSRPATPARATLKSQKQAKSCDDSTAVDRESVRVPEVTGTRQSLRRHMSVDLQREQLREQAEQSEKGAAAASGQPKSSKFKNFLARMKRQDVTATHRASDKGAGQKEESDSDKDKDKDITSSRGELEDEFDTSGASFSDRAAKRHRWSLRMRSPFGGPQSSSGQPGEQHAYLGVNLDAKRIKSNVSSFKSHLGERLSDTGKRASVLADQLIASIKDTTKEQLLLATTGTPARDRYDTLPNSFASSSPAQNDPLLVQKQCVLAKDSDDSDGLNTQQRRAKMFSLIYMHQQQQATAAGGRPVITRQPASVVTGGLGSVLRSRAPPPPPPPRPPPPSCAVVSGDQSKPSPDVATSHEPAQPPVDQEKKLVDPTEQLLLTRFRAFKSDARVRRQATDSGVLANEYRRLSQTIAPRDKELAATDALKSAAKSEPKRRSSCTV